MTLFPFCAPSQTLSSETSTYWQCLPILIGRVSNIPERATRHHGNVARTQIQNGYRSMIQFVAHLRGCGLVSVTLQST